MKMRKIFNWVLLLCLAVIALPAHGILIEPANIVVPSTLGEMLSFDYQIVDPMGATGTSFQITIYTVGPGGLTFNEAGCLSVVTDDEYWVYGNSAGASALDRGGNNYEYGDGPDDPPAEVLSAGDILARFAFIWDGVNPIENYMFCIDLDITKSLLLNESGITESFQFSPGKYPGSDTCFSIPEPNTLLLFIVGLVTLRKCKP